MYIMYHPPKCIMMDVAGCFQRTMKKRGEKKRRSDDSKDKFILSEYERISSEVATLSSPDAYPEIEPKNDIGYNAMLSSKAAILKLRKEQHVMHVNRYAKYAIFSTTYLITLWII
jgi:hypothetical protein